MRIALPVRDGVVHTALGSADGFQFYEDDHGKVKVQYFEALSEKSTDAAVELLERHGIDALVVPSLSDEERRAAFAAGIMFLPGFSGEPQQAALAFLSGAIGFDPNNPCNACGHNGGCSMECGSCSLKK
ncbi:MAG: NifB/NifX family molybdenum-iron cluster-binding protein [Oscillospiraceae bacterium]|nr:NifB/NifX family molybdenum-iron cluster-binding protein [Oscillospiraceae bacterium]